MLLYIIGFVTMVGVILLIYQRIFFLGPMLHGHVKVVKKRSFHSLDGTPLPKAFADRTGTHSDTYDRNYYKDKYYITIKFDDDSEHECRVKSKTYSRIQVNDLGILSYRILKDVDDTIPDHVLFKGFKKDC